MLKINSETLSNREYQLHINQIDDEIISCNDPVYRTLTVGINRVDNSTEEKINQSAYYSYDGEKNSSGWLKRMLIGISVLTGTGLLAVGGYYCYLLGRANSSGTSEGGLLSYPEPPLSLADDIIVNNPSVILEPDLQEAEYFTDNPESSRSPYSYYEKYRMQVR